MLSDVFFDQKVEHQTLSFAKDVQLRGLPVGPYEILNVVLWKVKYPTGPWWLKTFVQ